MARPVHLTFAAYAARRVAVLNRVGLDPISAPEAMRIRIEPGAMVAGRASAGDKSIAPLADPRRRRSA